MSIDENVDLSTLDRGNVIEPADTTEADAAAAATAATAAAEAEAAEALVKAGEKPADEAPRGPDGKFTKKEPETDAKPIGIPKTVFDERIGAERAARLAAEQRAAELQAKIDQAAHSVDATKLEEDIVALEKQYTKLMMEGDGEKAAATMRDIRVKTGEMQELKASQQRTVEQRQSAAERAAEEEKARVVAIIETAQTAHPEFDDKSDQFNPKLVNFVLAEQARLINDEGLSPSAALQRAVDDVMELRGTPTLTDAATATAGKDSAAERKTAAVATALAASKAQPGSMKEIGMDSDKAGTNRPENEDAAQMTYEEFAALPESTKAKMRGDTI